MASGEVITVGTWEERGTTMGPVLSALDRLRRCDRRGAVRASFLTLLAVGGRSVEVDEVFDTVHRLGIVQPTRVVVVRVIGRKEPRLDARVGVHLQSRGERCLGIDDVALEVGGPLTDHLDSLVEPLTLPDLPVVVWCRERLPPARSRLIDLADHLVVDTTAAGGRDRLPALARLHQRTPVVDFAWLRLQPLRQALGAWVRRPAFRPLLDQLDAITVSGPDVDRALLGAWLGDRLAATTVVEGPTTDQPSLTLTGKGLRLEVAARSGAVVTTLEQPGRDAGRGQTAAPPAHTEELLAQALLHLQPDPVYARTLAIAASPPPILEDRGG